jgi:chromosome segregation ATPase
LEDEKVRILQTIRSSKPDGVVDDIEKAVVYFCDKIASLEQECDSLCKYKNKAVSTSNKIESLQNQNTSLKNQVSELQKKIDHLVWAETGNNNLVTSLRESIEKLRREADQARQATETLQNEKRGQLRYLEQENLQLMIDYKAAKKQLYDMKAELSVLQLSHQPPKPIVANASKTPISSGRPPTVLSSSQSRTPYDKENSKNYYNHDIEKKRNSVQGSTKAASTGSSPRENRVTARLGDAFSVGEENTQECKQS